MSAAKQQVTSKYAVFDYESISTVTGKTKNAIYQDYTRGNLDLESLESIAVYISRHATPDIKSKMFLAMTEHGLDLSIINKKRKEFLKKRSASRQKQATARVSKRMNGKPPE